MNVAQRVVAVDRLIKVRLSLGVVVTLRPALAGEAAAAGLLPTDAPSVSIMDAEEYEDYKEMILDKAKPLILKCGISPVWVDGEGDPDSGTVSYDTLSKGYDKVSQDRKNNDVISCYLATMDGAAATAEALNEQFPSADRDQETIAIVSQAFGRNPLEVEVLPLPEWIRLLRYAKLCGAVKVKEEK